jgi:hypothetical protein
MDDSAACMHPHLNCTSLLNTNIWRKKKGYWIYCNPHEQSYLSRRNKICSFGPLKVQRQTQKVDDDTTGVVWTNIAWASCMCYTKKSWRSWIHFRNYSCIPVLNVNSTNFIFLLQTRWESSACLQRLGQGLVSQKCYMVMNCRLWIYKSPHETIKKTHIKSRKNLAVQDQPDWVQRETIFPAKRNDATL